MSATTGVKKYAAQHSYPLSVYSLKLFLFILSIFVNGAVAGAMRELLLESSPSSPSTPGQCSDPYCRQYEHLRLHLKPQHCPQPPPPPPALPRLPSPPAVSPPPRLPGFPNTEAAPITAYCGLWRTIGSGDTCATIVKLFNLPSVDFLLGINPTLNCNAPQVGLRLCVNRFSQWSIVNCPRFVSLWDGDSCQSVVNANLATLPFGLDDLYYCNGGSTNLNCANLFRGMIVCVYCI